MAILPKIYPNKHTCNQCLRIAKIAIFSVLSNFDQFWVILGYFGPILDVQACLMIYLVVYAILDVHYQSLRESILTSYVCSQGFRFLSMPSLDVHYSCLWCLFLLDCGHLYLRRVVLAISSTISILTSLFSLTCLRRYDIVTQSTSYLREKVTFPRPDIQLPQSLSLRVESVNLNLESQSSCISLQKSDICSLGEGSLDS